MAAGVSGIVNYNNYAALHFDPATRNVRVVFHDGNGATLADRTYQL